MRASLCWFGGALGLALVGTAGCGGDSGDPSMGDLTVLLEPEDVLVDGLPAGDGAADIRDGWSVAFDRYLVAIGDVDVHLATDESITASDHEVFVVDLSALPASGAPLWSLDGLQAGRWEFHYATPGAGDGAIPHDTVELADFEAMEANDWTYLVDATLTHPAGQSCPPASLAEVNAEPNGATNARGEACYDNPTIHIEWGAAAPVELGPCEVDGVPGFAMPEGGRQTVAVTIHGDHLFFNGFPEGEEGGITRLAQWIADSDLNLDGEVTRAELERLVPADLAAIDARYALGGSPRELSDMWEYVVAQLQTQGHFQGEGECAIDGQDHGH